MKPNWKSIRFEYVTTGQSYRDLCEKYGDQHLHFVEKGEERGLAGNEKN